MEIFIYLLSLYFTAINVLPCADLETPIILLSSSKDISLNENHYHKQENDLCLPFYNRNCCGILMLNCNQVDLIFLNIISKITSLLPSNQSPSIVVFNKNIWQSTKIIINFKKFIPEVNNLDWLYFLIHYKN